MASLNLIPDPTVLAVQAGIFLANVAIIKKLIVEPYVVMRDKRSLLTVGSKDEAEKLLLEAERLSQSIATRLVEAAAKAKSQREQSRVHATNKRQQILSAAESEAKASIAQVETQVKAELASERLKIPGLIASLTDEAFRVATN